nr:hypothetical protein [Tanacetum cinerariifolium]
MVIESLENAVLANESSQPKFTYEVAASLTEFELKKILIDKMDESQSYLTSTEHRECYDGLIKPRVEKEEDNKDAELTKGPISKESKSGSSKGTKSQSASSRKSVHAEEPKFEVADSNMPQDQEENPRNDDEVPKGKTKAAQYDLPGIEDMVQNIWSPVKVAYDKHALWVFYIGEINERPSIVRRADNDLYTFKECDFPRLCFNDIEDMLILIVQNRLTNLSGNDVYDFAIAYECSREAWLFKRESKIFNWESKVTRRRSTSPSMILHDSTSGKRTHTLHIKTLKDSFMLIPKGEIS